ncbi:hypothetical protein BDQ12DRAFT_106727 [Crucibulum laeve]|uniref:Uncharacterized protein n=1 Tax=Crucibulum laeve TaxID=68775 RepID=A0A5C3LHE8_9AGAR|nr:hypothetical protein BDQ12DRAFT_106727 [Crucibulum laeve]
MLVAVARYLNVQLFMLNVRRQTMRYLSTILETEGLTTNQTVIAIIILSMTLIDAASVLVASWIVGNINLVSTFLTYN